MEKIILATASPTRRKLAKIMGIDFDVIPSNYIEDISLKLPPKELAMELAFGKAQEFLGQGDLSGTRQHCRAAL